MISPRGGLTDWRSLYNSNRKKRYKEFILFGYLKYFPVRDENFIFTTTQNYSIYIDLMLSKIMEF